MKPELRVAIVHYHLRPGGVTRVIERTLAALNDASIRTVVLHGPAAGPTSELVGQPGIIEVEGLGYQESGVAPVPADVLRNQLLQAARSALGGAVDVWHFHNHSLGKNCVVPRVVRRLAEDGERLLLQIHDFAEDGRPSNYMQLLRDVADDESVRLGDRLYPQASHVHYATLNARDTQFLIRAGVDQGRAHLLRNPIAAHPATRSQPSAMDRPFFLYPTRGIRRKNLGEFLLWAAMHREDARFGVTLAPTHPADLAHYRDWCELAVKERLPVEFELGLRTDRSYDEWVDSASAIVTTSVAEGFGLAFLEPWLSNKTLMGRNIPAITADLALAGIELAGLYEQLQIPLHWVGRDSLRARLTKALTASRAAYRRTTTPSDIERALAAAMPDRDRVDFGRLDEALQRDVILQICQDPLRAREIQPYTFGGASVDVSHIPGNRAAVLRSFGLEEYGRHLTSVYRSVAGSPVSAVGGIAPADALLEQFLDPAAFFLLRT